MHSRLTSKHFTNPEMTYRELERMVTLHAYVAFCTR